jgi:hypothetical protein
MVAGEVSRKKYSCRGWSEMIMRIAKLSGEQQVFGTSGKDALS